MRDEVATDGCSDETTAAGGMGGAGDTGGDGGSGGTAGDGGSGGTAGDGGSGAGGEPTLCEANMGGSGGALGAGGSVGADASCVDDVCPCSEAGIRAAVHAGGGPYTFDCDGPTTIAVNPMDGGLLLDRDVSLDGEGKLTVLFGFVSVDATITAELRGLGISTVVNRIGCNQTVITNSAVSGNKLGAIANCGEVTMTNTVIEGHCAWDGAFQSEGGNIESPGDTCGFDQPTDQVNVSAEDLKLGELADNGGPTMTHALGAGSVAINQIPVVDCVDADGAPLMTDQRGEPRPGGTMCDVGAFEVQP